MHHQKLGRAQITLTKSRVRVAGEKKENPNSLATLWVVLNGMKEQLDNVAIPLGYHLSLEDPELMMAMEELSGRISRHVEKYRLVAEPRRSGKV